MTNNQIYEHALALLGLSPDVTENEDFTEQAPYHLAAFCTQAEETDRWLRKTEGAEDVKEFHKVFMPLEEDFPLSDRMAPIAALYLAAMLILDEDAERSDRLYDRYTEAMSELSRSLPAFSESIVQVYF